MGFKQAAILAPVSFFLGTTLWTFLRPKVDIIPGILFICSTVDYRLLWGQVTNDVINDGLQFYTTFFNAPPAIKVPFSTPWARNC